MKFNLDSTLKGTNLVAAFDRVRDLTRSDLGSALLVRSDDPKTIRTIKQKVQDTTHCVYIRLGIACNVNKIEREILRNLTLNSLQWKTSRARAVPRIRQKLAKGEVARCCIVVDSANFVSSGKASTIIGLMLEFYGLVQFIFLLPEDYIATWQKETDKPMMNLFLKCLTHKYDLR